MSSIDAVGEMHRVTAQTAYQAPAGWNSLRNNRGNSNHSLSDIGCFEQGVFMTLRPVANSPVAKVTVSVSPIVRQSDGGREGGLLFNQLTCFSLGYTPAQRLSPPGSFEAGQVDDFMGADGQGQTINQYYFEIDPLSENALRVLFSPSRKKMPNNAQTASVVIKPESGGIDCGTEQDSQEMHSNCQKQASTLPPNHIQWAARPRNTNLGKTNMNLTYTGKIWSAAMFITMVGAFIAAGQTENFNTINSITTGVGGNDVRVTAESQTPNDLVPATMVSDEAPAVANYFEGFEDVGPTGSPDSGPQNLINQGWIFRNQSSPLGTDSWFQGYTGYIWPPPQAGSGYMAVTSNSTDFFGGTVSNWAILPALQGQQAGDEVRFYLTDLYGTDGDNISTLQVRYSPNGGTNTGSTASSVGDFTQLLLDINPVTVGWNLYSVTVPGNGRIALRYFVPNACNFACYVAYTGIDSLSVGPPPAPPCNLPPIPASGQTVTWTAAGGPYEICQNVAIPPNSTVIVEPNVQINFDPNVQLTVSGTMRHLGQAAQHVVVNAPAAFPPMIDINGGVFETSFVDFTGQVRVENGADVTLTNSRFIGSRGVFWVQESPSVQPFIRIEGCTFESSSSATISDAITVLRNNVFNNGSRCLLLRGFSDVTSTNTFIGADFTVNRQESYQPFFINGVHASNNATAGLILAGGNYFIGSNTFLQNNTFPVSLEGGLLPGSAVALAGNANNSIDVGTGGFAGRARWSQLGLPYRLTQPTTEFPGGHLTVDPGVLVEAADSGAEMRFRSTRHGVFKGLPNAPITFQGLNGQSWSGFVFHANATTGNRMEYCTVSNANVGIVSTDNAIYADSCRFMNNYIGANMNTSGIIYFAKTRFLNNSTGMNFSAQGRPFLNSPLTPNSFEGNGFGIDAFDFLSSADAGNCWWNHPSGPQVAGNPGGQGDSIVGLGAPNVQFSPFLTAPPSFANTPPVVRVIEPGLTQLYDSPDLQIPDFLLDQGTKYILRWSAEDSDTIVSQRIDFSPDGHYQDHYFTLVPNLPGSARSWEITLPDPGFAATNSPQFLRVVASDAAGQEGWDQTAVLVPSGRINGTLTITTNLNGQTFTAGRSIPNVQWTGSVDFGLITPVVVLESDGAAMVGLNVGGQGIFGQKFPFVSTDRARLALQVRNNSNDTKWFFADGYFSIRHDQRLGFVPPNVNLTSPVGGEIFPSTSTVPIRWTAGSSEGLRSFDIQASYDDSRTWHPIVRDLSASATSYDWQLPQSSGISNVRVRIIARDIRFQNSSSTSGAFNISPAPPTAVSISGAIAYCSNPNHTPVSGVRLNLTGGMTSFVLSDSSGNYLFTSLPAGGSYTVSPTKTPLTPAADNINTLDVIAMQRHFLRIGTPLSGCPLTAADVNGDTAVNSVDIIAVQRFVLGFLSGTANVGNYQFNPLSRVYSTVTNNQTNQNYDALIFGDVTAGFVHRGESSSDLGSGEADNRTTADRASTTVAVLALSEATTSAAGTQSIIPVNVSAINAESGVVGFQGDLLFDERMVSFQDEPVQKAGLTDGDWNVSANVLPGSGPKRTLRISAFSNSLTPLSGSGTLFNLRVTGMSRGGQTGLLTWAAAPNDFFFIDLDLKPHRAADAAALGNVGDL